MTYRETLQHPIVAKLSLIQLISYFGTWFSQVAIFSMLVALDADAMTISITAMVSMLPAVILSPLTGSLIDRIDFKKLMLALLLIEIAMTLGFIFIDSLAYIGILLLLIFIRSAASSMLFSAEMALFPRILEGEMLKNTNEIHSIIWSLCYALGMAAGGIATYYWGYDTSFVIDAALYGVAVLILLGLEITPKEIIHTDSIVKMLKDGLTYIMGHKKILHLILIHSAIGLTSFDALITLLADYQYKELIAVPLAIGIMNAIRAVGLMMGPFFIGKVISTKNLHWFFLLQGGAIILWGFLEYNFYLGLIALFVTGFFITTLWSYTYLLVQQETDPHYMGRVISYNDMLFMLSNAMTALFIGYAYTFGLSLVYVTMLLGAGFVLFAIYYRWFQKRYL
jgi:MFS family permease